MIDPGAWGVENGFWDISGVWREASPDALASILDSMGAAEGLPPPPVLVTVRRDHQLPPVPSGSLSLEDGAELRIDGPLPPDVPTGYHVMLPDRGDPFRLVVSPGRAPLPSNRTWGFSAQLYATRSTSSWGVGDLDDLERLGRWSAGLGARLVLVNPLHAGAPGIPQQPSPYYPCSRCFLNPLYISVGDVPGSSAVAGFDRALYAGRALNAGRLIDRDAAWSIKSGVLEDLFRSGIDAAALDAYRKDRGELLGLFATFCAIQEMEGTGWRSWPAELRHPRSPAVRSFRASTEGEQRIRYHSWLQLLLDAQLERAGRVNGIVQDLAVGVDPGGADSWVWQEELAQGMNVGAPRDEFSTLGQDWGFPPFDPWRLRSAGYSPWIEALRSGLRHSAGLRIDHVMGLFRLYWIPEGGSPDGGAYVRYPHHDLLNILTLEAERAEAHVVGEDLGTVEDGAREDLHERQVLSYRVWWFEPGSPGGWPVDALGAVSTHDLPTIAGVLTGSDLASQRELGLEPNEGASLALRDKVVELAGWQPGSVPEAILRVHQDLSRAPCLVLTATLDDVMMVDERPNMPGTVDEWPNWRLALPATLEEVERSRLAVEIASALSRRGIVIDDGGTT